MATSIKAGNLSVGMLVIVNGQVATVVTREGIWLPKKNGRMHGVRLVFDNGITLELTANKRLPIP